MDVKKILLIAQRHVAAQSPVSDADSHRESHHPALPSLPSDVPEANDQQALDHAHDRGHEKAADAGATTLKAFQPPSRTLFNSNQMTAVSAVGIRVASFPRTPCTPWCSCICHTESRYRSPRFFDQVLGTLFVGYSGSPVGRQQCNEKSCHLQSQPMSYVTYYFPQWFLSRVVTLTMTNTPLAGPVASLKVRRTIPGDAEIFTQAKSGSASDMKALFEKGLASPHDVHYDSGVTALHVCCSLLIVVRYADLWFSSPLATGTSKFVNFCYRQMRIRFWKTALAGKLTRFQIMLEILSLKQGRG